MYIGLVKSGKLKHTAYPSFVEVKISIENFIQCKLPSITSRIHPSRKQNIAFQELKMY
jgi:hypothetical protein